MIKKVYVILIFVLYASLAWCEIDLSTGKWETSFDCVVWDQFSTLSCDGLSSGGNWSFYTKDMSSEGWVQSNVATEWYYNSEIPTATFKSITVNGVLFKTGTVGSLSDGQCAWGDNDLIGYNTFYIRSSSNPGTLGTITGFFTRSYPQENDYVSQITTLGNNSMGSGKGFRTWDGDGIDIDTGPIAAVFPSPQTELWIRWYQRHQVGFKWDSNSGGNVPLFNKNVYLFTGKQGNAAIAEYYYDKYVIVSQGTPNYYQVMTADGDGWTGVMRDSVSDGEFHCFEIHVKMDTNSSNGIGQIWIDGVLKASNQSVDWSGGDETARAGWTYFKLGENQSSPENAGPMYVDYDDLVVYNTTPTNQDAYGNYFIGPIETQSNPVVEILTASGQTTTASVFTITGTATADTDQTISGVTCTGQTVTPDDGTWDELEEAFTCLASLAFGENTLVFIGSDGTRAGQDSITVTRIKKTSKINGSATIKNATIH